MTDLIEGRECGTCTVCCQDLLIDDAALKKLPGEMCPICKPAEGCSLYLSRPDTCRNWHCGWRLLPLGDEWRPDRSQILIFPTGATKPVRVEEGLEFKLVGDYSRVISEPFVVLVERLLNRGTPVYLSVPRELGYHAMQAHLNANEAMVQAAADKDYNQIAALLTGALEAVLVHPAQKVEFTS
jgi:hypothetical protein